MLFFLLGSTQPGINCTANFEEKLWRMAATTGSSTGPVQKRSRLSSSNSLMSLPLISSTSQPHAQVVRMETNTNNTAVYSSSGEDYDSYSSESDHGESHRGGGGIFYSGRERARNVVYRGGENGQSGSSNRGYGGPNYADYEDNSEEDDDAHSRDDRSNSSTASENDLEMEDIYEGHELWNREGMDMTTVHVDADLHEDSVRASSHFRDLLRGGGDDEDDSGEDSDDGINTARNDDAAASKDDPYAFVVENESKGSTDGASNDKDVGTYNEFEQQKQQRLQRLLKRTDHIVNAIHNSMTLFVKKAKEANIEGENVDVDVETTSDNMEQGSSNAEPPQSSAVNEPTTAAAAPSDQSNNTRKYLRGRILRNYQEGGVEWLNSLHQQGLNGILADEMGLGKTLMVLTYLATLWEMHGIWGPHLVVVPMSVISSWKEELSRFVPGFFDVYIHHGQKDERRETFTVWRKAALAAKRAKQQAGSVSSAGGKVLNGGHGRVWPRGVPTFMVSLCFTTYDIALRDMTYLQKLGHGPLRWQYLVVDEAHRLKNRSSALFDALNKTHAARRLLLTGTPLQNNLTELWSLLSFVLPEIFNDIQDYAEWFNRPFELGDDEEPTKVTGESRKRKATGTGATRGKKSGKPRVTSGISALQDEERALIVSSVQRILKPFLLRRLKSDVIAELPKKIERVVMCPSSALQKTCL